MDQKRAKEPNPVGNSGADSPLKMSAPIVIRRCTGNVLICETWRHIIPSLNCRPRRSLLGNGDHSLSRRSRVGSLIEIEHHDISACINSVRFRRVDDRVVARDVWIRLATVGLAKRPEWNRPPKISVAFHLGNCIRLPGLTE
jgi:hypothetical protein